MSDPTNETSPAAPPEPVKIDFDRAEPVSPAAEHVACGLCGREITDAYWQSLGKVLCEPCREGLERTTAAARGGATFGKAFLVGGAAALGCGIGYAVFVGVSHIQFALVTIGIGWAVGRAIQRVTRGFGGVKHQVLAVALTYLASSMGYLPAMFTAIANSGDHADQGAASATASATPSAAPSSAADPPSSPARDAPATTETSAPSGGEHGVGASLVILAGIMLAAPFLEIGDGLSGILGLLIIFFGLRTAWRVSKGVEAHVTGPHRIAGS